MSFWKHLEKVLVIQASAHLIQHDNWENEMLQLLSDSNKLHAALIRIAYDIGSMDDTNQQAIIVRLQLKSLNQDESRQLLSYIEYLKKVENDLMQFIAVESEHNWIDFAPIFSKMQYVEIAAHYGLLKSYSDQYPKAEFFCKKIEDFFKAKQ